jgi:hypothetical protein
MPRIALQQTTDYGLPLTVYKPRRYRKFAATALIRTATGKKDEGCSNKVLMSITDAAVYEFRVGLHSQSLCQNQSE